MVFSSYGFLFIFLPLVLMGYFSLAKIKNDVYQKGFLIAASLVFYGYYNVYYLFLIIASIVLNYGFAFAIQKMQEMRSLRAKHAFLAAGILFNVLLIGYFKYYDFFIENVNHVFGTGFALRRIALPLGISFFTFQQLSFLIAIHQGDERIEKLHHYSLFVTFFPQLVAGPIVLYSEMIPQFKDESRRAFCFDRFASGMYIFIIGLFKKAVIADTFAMFVGNGFGAEQIGFIPAWIVSLSYTLQIYFDFSGYSDMAVGLAQMFNIDIPFNFLSPYQSGSITEFWRRWHITLGRALSTYIYRPLGGNKKGMLRTCINLFITFLISGLWHGAAWTFVLWGCLHGVLMVAERLAAGLLKKIPAIIRRAYTFLSVNLLWVLFRAGSFEEARVQYGNMFGFSHAGWENLYQIPTNGVVNYPDTVDNLYILFIVAVFLGIVFFCKNSKSRLEGFKPSAAALLVSTVLFVLSVVCLSRQSVFIYFNF